MNIGIVGSGNIGATAARLFADAGHEVVVSNSRGPESLVPLVEEIGFAPVDTGSLTDGGRRREARLPNLQCADDGWTCARGAGGDALMRPVVFSPSAA